jgi:hypothetical protein
LLIFSGCYNNHLYVQQEWVDASFLASSKVKTPDPRQLYPYVGERLIIAWDFPKSLFSQGLNMVVTVRLWDDTQKVFRQPIVRKRDATSLFFPECDGGKIITYKVQVYNQYGDEVTKWEHHFWAELITVGDTPKSSILKTQIVNNQ